MTETAARIIDFSAYRTYKSTDTEAGSEPAQSAPVILPVAFYCFWPILAWMPPFVSDASIEEDFA